MDTNTKPKKREQRTLEETIEWIKSDEYTMSFSQWSRFNQSPRHLIQYLMGEQKQTKYMKFSKQAHCYILEPEEVFKSRYLINEAGVYYNSPNEKRYCNERVWGKEPVEALGAAYSVTTWSRNKIESEARQKETKFAQWIELRKKALEEEKKIISLTDWNRMKTLKKIFEMDGALLKYREEAAEVELKAECTIKDVKFRGVLDLVGKDFVCDLKILASADTRKAMNYIINEYVYVQGAIYQQMRPGREVKIIVLDHNGHSNIITISPELLEAGLEKCEERLSWFDFCKRTDAFWASYNFYSEEMNREHVLYPPWWMGK